MFDTEQTCPSITRILFSEPSKPGTRMTDVYVYYFLQTGSNGVECISTRRATLETIAGLGNAVMESQIVVDHTEVDDNGYVRGHDVDESNRTDLLRSQITSLERRAESRDNEAILLNDVSDAKAKYLLAMESRELRKQATRLRAERLDSLTGGVTGRSDPGVCSDFTEDPITG
jgi:hypothetical protein